MAISVLKEPGPIKLLRPLFPKVPVAGRANAAVLKYLLIKSVRDRLTSSRPSAVTLALCAPSPLLAPTKAISLPEVTVKGWPETLDMMPDSRQEPTTCRIQPWLSRRGSSHTPLIRKIWHWSKSERPRSPAL